MKKTLELMNQRAKKEGLTLEKYCLLQKQNLQNTLEFTKEVCEQVGDKGTLKDMIEIVEEDTKLFDKILEMI